MNSEGKQEKGRTPLTVKTYRMTNDYKFIAGLLLGAVAGAALAAFIKSEQGKELISEVKEGADKIQIDLHGKLKEFDASINELLEKGRAFINDLEQRDGQQVS